MLNSIERRHDDPRDQHQKQIERNRNIIDAFMASSTRHVLAVFPEVTSFKG